MRPHDKNAGKGRIPGKSSSYFDMWKYAHPNSIARKKHPTKAQAVAAGRSIEIGPWQLSRHKDEV